MQFRNTDKTKILDGTAQKGISLSHNHKIEMIGQLSYLLYYY